MLLRGAASARVDGGRKNEEKGHSFMSLASQRGLFRAVWGGWSRVRAGMATQDIVVCDRGRDQNVVDIVFVYEESFPDFGRCES